MFSTSVKVYCCTQQILNLIFCKQFIFRSADLGCVVTMNRSCSSCCASTSPIDCTGGIMFLCCPPIGACIQVETLPAGLLSTCSSFCCAVPEPSCYVLYTVSRWMSVQIENMYKNVHAAIRQDPEHEAKPEREVKKKR